MFLAGATYTFTNDDAEPCELKIALPFPAQKAVFADLRFDLEGANGSAPPAPGGGNITGYNRLAPGQTVTPRVGYRSQGLDRCS
ncbi:MAG: hypothetical protein FJY56_10815 [Betaproteobacteria bacterium]|nr:hypothetical protein [Betaproteobacteria bacterium]